MKSYPFIYTCINSAKFQRKISVSGFYLVRNLILSLTIYENMYYMYDYLNNHCKQCKEMKPYNIAFWEEEISIPKYHNPS